MTDNTKVCVIDLDGQGNGATVTRLTNFDRAGNPSVKQKAGMIKQKARNFAF